jgi:hypothetical protein
MSRLRRAAGAARRFVVGLMPTGRRDWVEALWTEADEAPPGWQRLAWRAGGVRLVARESVTRRRARRMLLFAEAAALMARATWRGPPDGPVATFARVDVIVTILLLTVLPLLSRRLFGPVRDSKVARTLRVSAYAAILALMPAKAAIEQFAFTVPRNIHDRRLFSAIGGPPGANPDYGIGEIVFLVVIAACLAAIFWITSRGSLVTPATMAIGAGGGVLFGAVMYSVTPLGVNKYATNPWLPGSDVDPLVVLAWVLLLGGPVAAALLAGRCYPGPVSSGPPTKTKVGQGFVAGLLANLSGALIVTVLGMSTIALMLHATWLRTLFDHGHHLNAIVVYSHEIDAATNAQGYLLICVAFPVIGLFMSMMGAAGIVGDGSEAGQGGPPPRGGPGQPGPAPDQPDGGRRPEAEGGVEGLTACPFPDPGRDDDEGRADLVGAAAGGPMTRTR